MREHSSFPSSQEGASSPRKKQLGRYLVEAGLLTPAQIDVALKDQQSTGMRFGEILAARGWVKQQTIEYFMEKVILPEQATTVQKSPKVDGTIAKEAASTKQIEEIAAVHRHEHYTPEPGLRRELPIAKPLPTVPANDDDVSWVG